MGGEGGGRGVVAEGCALGPCCLGLSMLIWGPLCVLTVTVYRGGSRRCFLRESHHQLTLLHTYDVGDAIWIRYLRKPLQPFLAIEIG